jgi:hypothetical protein
MKLYKLSKNNSVLYYCHVFVKSDASQSKAVNPDRSDLAQGFFLGERRSAL